MLTQHNQEIAKKLPDPLLGGHMRESGMRKESACMFRKQVSQSDCQFVIRHVRQLS